MSNEVFYVVKGTVLAQGKILLKHNQVLDQKSDHELRETVKQAIPGMSEEHLSNMGRSQLEDILQSDRGKGSSTQAEHTLGGDITPAT